MTASACMAVLSGRSLFLRARLPAAGLDAGATGTAVSTLFHLACGLAEKKEEAK